MKTVRVENNIVMEIIPEYATPVVKWYGTEFASHCMEAPDHVDQGYVYDPETGEFSEPTDEGHDPETHEKTIDERVSDLEITAEETREALEMILSGVTE